MWLSYWFPTKVYNSVQSAVPEGVRGGASALLINLVHKLVCLVSFFRNDQLGFEYKLDIFNEYARYAKIGIDGAFVDVPATYRRALELLYPEEQEDGGQGETCTNGNSKIILPTVSGVLLLSLCSFIF